MFKMTGRFNGKEATATWDNGTLSGDPEAVQAVQELADAMEGLPVSFATELPSTTNHLQKPLAALALIAKVFQDGKITGDLPPIENVEM